MAPRQSKRDVSRTDPSAAVTGGREQRTDTTASPSRHLEIETKLEIADDAVLPSFRGRRPLVAAGLVDAAEPVVFDLDAVYFDTSELDLLRSKLTLRRRTGGEDAGWHLKLPAAAGARTEVGLPLETVDVDPLIATVPAPLADLVQGIARGRALQPVARIRNRRTVRRLLDAAGTAMVEVADDQVTATRISSPAGDPSSTPGEGEARRWRELEVEVLAGDRRHLSAVVAVLHGAGATPASSASKLGRALGSSTAEPPKRPRTAGSAVITSASRLRDTLIGADRALREETDTSLHDARAAARRLRSVLEIYRSLFTAGSTRHLRAGLQSFGAVLGPARDLQVLQHRLTGQLVDEPAEYAAAAKARIDREMAATVPPALAAVGEYIRSADYLELLRRLDAFLAHPPFSGRTGKVAPTLAASLADGWSELAGLVDTATADPSEENGFHDVRKAAKALRYASESAAPVLGESAVMFAAAIEEIQEVLGERQDALTSGAWLADLAVRDTDGVAGFVFGRLHAFEEAVALGTLDDFTDAWDRLADGELARTAFGR